MSRRVKKKSAFGDWLDRHDKNGQNAADALGITRAMVSYLATGSAEPGNLLAQKIEMWTASVSPGDVISARSWVLDELMAAAK